MPYQTLLIAIDEGVATLTLNLPQTRNAFSKDLLRELRTAIAELGSNTEVRALILTGAGAGFCAGADLGAQRSTDARARADAGAETMRKWINPLALELRSAPFPVIAAVNGAAAGAGASFALAADVVIAARSAFFLFPFMPRLGIVPDMGATWHLAHRVGPARAMALCLLGDRLPAEKAEEWGLIWRCVDDAELMNEARAVALRCAAGPAHAATELRQALALAQDQNFSAQLDYERERQRDLLARAEFGEGALAFLEKREPRFPARGG